MTAGRCDDRDGAGDAPRWPRRHPGRRGHRSTENALRPLPRRRKGQSGCVPRCCDRGGSRVGFCWCRVSDHRQPGDGAHVADRRAPPVSCRPPHRAPVTTPSSTSSQRPRPNARTDRDPPSKGAVAIDTDVTPNADELIGHNAGGIVTDDVIRSLTCLNGRSAPRDHVAQSLRRLELSPFQLHKEHIRGFVDDVGDGRLHEVTRAAP